MIIQRQLTLDVSQTTLEALKQLAPELSTAQLKQALYQGAVWYQAIKQKQPQRIRRAKRLLKAQEQIFLNYNDEVLQQPVPKPQLIQDCADWSVWYKPKGLLSQGSKWGDHHTLYRQVEISWQRPCWLVHRLDKATDGLMLLAHSKQKAQQLTQLFEQRQVDKTYVAQVRGHFLDSPLHLTTPLDGKQAHSLVTLIDYDAKNHTSWVQVQIFTGRKHQIRQHLAQIGFAIIGDRLHGDEVATEDLQLTAIALTLKGEIESLQQTFQLPQDLMPITVGGN